jgi:hypothetical protein
MAHPELRVRSGIFARLDAAGQHGAVKLTPEQQQEFLRRDPASFTPAAGARGRQGIHADPVGAADESVAGEGR